MHGGEEHTEWSVEGDPNGCQQRGALLVTLDLPSNATNWFLFRVTLFAKNDADVACLLELLVVLIQSTSLAAKKNTAAGFLEEEPDDDYEGGGDDGVRVVDPAPGCMCDNGTGQDRCQTCSE